MANYYSNQALGGAQDRLEGALYFIPIFVGSDIITKVGFVGFPQNTEAVYY